MEKRAKLVYDIVSTPKGLDIGNLVKIYEQHHVVFWDSKKEGTKPKLYGVDGTEAPLAVVDVEGKEMDLEFYGKQFAEEEFWNRELYNCKNSPVYFWKNYGTSVWPHTQEDLTAYLKEIGMDQIVAKDSEEAEARWKAQKERVKKATEHFTVEFLKERAGFLEVQKTRYEEKVAALESLVGDFVSLYDKGTPLEPKKRVANLMEKIRRVTPVLPKYSEKYRTKKGKWDIPMLMMTDYDVLLEIFYDVLLSKGKIKEVVVSTAKD